MTFLPLVVSLLVLPSAAPPFEFQDGDRVVFLGNTLIEREQRTGYWEAALTSRFHGRKIQFRNLGWSGDTVFGEARAGFDTPADGFRRLKEHTLALKPTLLIIGYGGNEAFDGPAGLPRFVAGLNTLLDALAPAKAEVVLLSPLKQEDLGRPLPDPAAQNKNLRLYADAIRDVAAKRGARFVDLYDLKDDKSKVALTDNGIHLTPYGYWKTATALERQLGLASPRSWRIHFDLGMAYGGAGAKVRLADEKTSQYGVTDNVLPLAPPAETAAEQLRWFRVGGLAAGPHDLLIDGKKVESHTAEEWAAGLWRTRGPDFDQAEKLRATIVAKNQLYFHRWRPQNETYLFGFRKHEQGQNAREIPQFDPLIAKAEEEIAKLAIPVAHTYELKQAPK